MSGNELYKLSKDSGLQIITCDVLNKEKYSHIVGVNYSSESSVVKEMYSEQHFKNGLFFRNRKCKFKEATNFNFIR